ncbi:hypothetical protein ACFLUW_01135 [Chloroflexota bacterium]
MPQGKKPATIQLPQKGKQRDTTASFHSGAFVKPITTERGMKFYPLNQNELHSITILNTATSIFGSLFVTFGILAIGLKFDAIMEGLLTEQAIMLSQVGFWAFLVLAIICGVVSIGAWKCRKSMLKNILSETEITD